MTKIIKSKVLIPALFITLLCVCLSVAIATPTSAEELTPTASGTCGENATWEYYASTGELKISGSGNMYNYTNNFNEAPWYAYRSDIKSVTVAEGITSIGDEAFAYCASLTGIEIPFSVTRIGNDAFYSCSDLKSIDIPSDVTYIGNCAFQYCSGLTSITIPLSVTYIGNNAFSSCYKLVEIYNLSNFNISCGSASDGYVGYYAKVIHASENDESIIENINGYQVAYFDEAYYILGYTGKDIALTLPSSFDYKGTVVNQYKIYSHAFRACSGLKSVELPTGVTSVGDFAFYWCSSLESIEIPFGVTSIGNYAFYNCDSLIDSDLPSSITDIGNLAFAYCDSLKSLTFLSKVPPILENDTLSSSPISSIYVPASSVDTYKSNESFAPYKDIIFPIESDIRYGDANGDGEVGAADVLLLRKYMANYDYETEISSVTVSKGADANGDGAVTASDVLLMRKYMANYDYDTGTSSIVLGPKDEAVEHTHTEVIDAAVSATCTETGLTEGKHCSVCNEVIVAQQTVAAGHIYGDDLICDLCGDDKLHFNGGTGADSSPYLISTAKHLDNIRLYPTAHYELINDIEFTSQDYIYSGDFYNSGSYWKPIDDFSGSIDGNGHEISGLKMTRSYSGETVNGITYTYADFGLFSSTSGKISDLTLSDVNMQIYVSQGDSHSTSVNVGALAGHSSGEITDCEAYGTITVTGNTDLVNATVGGIVGKSSGKIYSSYNYATIKADCTKTTYSYGSGTYSSHSSAGVGGIVGYFIGTDIFNCKNYGSVYANSIREPHAGGIVAESSSFNINSLIIGCYNYGAVEAVSTPPAKIDSSYNSYGYLTACAGGIAARVSYDETGIFNCGNFADVTAKGWSAHSGGVVSAVYNKSQITQCFNQGGVLAFDTDTSSAFIYGNQYAGGISAGGGLIDKCYNSGDVTATGKDYVKSGGIAVYTFAKTSNSYNAGNISAQEGAYSYVGGIIAECPASIEYCYNIGELSGTNKGGIACTVYNGSGGTDIERHILSCYYIDNVTSGVYETLDSCTKQTYKKSDSEMKTQSTFVNFDFYNVWTISDGEYAYPQLKNNYHRTEEPIN